MSGNFVMKMRINKQVLKPPPPPPPQPPSTQKNFNLRTVINAPMRSAISLNAGRADCGCGGRH